MFRVSKKTKYFLGLLTLASILYVALFGLTSMGMNMSYEKGMATSMSPCPYILAGSSICTMNLFDQIQSWQNTFRAIPIKSIFVLILLISISLALVNWKQLREFYERYRRTRIRLYEKLSLEHPEPLLVQLFSQGILNPKSY